MARTNQKWPSSQYTKKSQEKRDIFRPLQNKTKFYLFNKYLENVYLYYDHESKFYLALGLTTPQPKYPSY